VQYSREAMMNISDLLWLFVLASMLQPLLARRLLDRARGRLRTQLERERGSRVILLVHRQETMSLFGIPLMRYIDIQDSEEVIRAILQTDPKTPIDLILHTPGGLALPSLQIARALSRHSGSVTAFVPHYAMSGGTLIALAAGKIVMSEHAVLGPIDPQVGGYPAASITRAVALKEAKDIEDDTLILADQAEMAVNQLRRAVITILEPRLRSDLAEYIGVSLSEGQWTHDYPITPGEAAGLGLPVSTDMPAAVLDMMALYPQPTRRTPSVEYGIERRAWRPRKPEPPKADGREH
jgi:ClpP class serine protease